MMETQLSKQRQFEAKRFRKALNYTIGATLITIIFSLFIFWGNSRIPLYTEFSEWTPQEDTATNDDIVDNNIFGYLEEKLNRWIDDFTDIPNAIRNNSHVGGLSRLAGILIFVIVNILYRDLLEEYYEIYGQPAHAKHFKEFMSEKSSKYKLIPTHKIDQFFVSLATAVTSYVLLSVIWIAFADIFEDVEFPVWQSVLVTSVFVSIVVYVVIHWALVITTRDLMIFGFLTFTVGLMGGFALANKDWVNGAVSTVGKDPKTDFLFSLTLISVSCLLRLLWIDSRKFIQDITIERQIFDKYSALEVVQWGYHLAILGIFLVGFVPHIDVEPKPWINYVTGLFHIGGASISVIIFAGGGMGWFTLYGTKPELELFSQQFKRFSVFFAFVILISFILYRSAVFTLTAFELISISIIGVWLYATVIHILLKAEELEAPNAI